MKTFTKDPQAVLDYNIDWTNWLDTDTISTSIFATDAGLTIDSDQTTAQISTVWLSGGVNNTRYTVTNTITTANGRTAERSFIIFINNK